MAIILKFRRRCNGFPSAAVRSPDFGELAVPGQPTGRVSRCPLLAKSRPFGAWVLMSALTPKADITEGYDLYPVLTQSGHQRNECLLATMNVAAGRFGDGTYKKGGNVSGRTALCGVNRLISW